METYVIAHFFGRKDDDCQSAKITRKITVSNVYCGNKKKIIKFFGIPFWKHDRLSLAVNAFEKITVSNRKI